MFRSASCTLKVLQLECSIAPPETGSLLATIGEHLRTSDICGRAVAEAGALFQKPFTLLLDDPLSLSYLELDTSNAPQSIVRMYQRSAEQDEQYHLPHVVTYAYVTNLSTSESPTFEVTEETLLPMKQYQSLFDLDRWYPALTEFTFPTVQLELSQDQAKALIHCFESRKVPFVPQLPSEQPDRMPAASETSSSKEVVTAPHDVNVTSEMPSTTVPELSAEEFQHKILYELAVAIQNAIQQLGGAAFVRLSTRSPKDAIPFGGRFSALFNARMSQVPAGDSNRDSIEFFRVVNHAMAINWGIEAVQILACSQRVHEDLSQWLQVNPGLFKMNVLVRKWEQIDPSMEFRVFVHNGMLTAITQYLHSCFFESLVSEKQHIKEKIVQFFDQVLKDKLRPLYKSYVIDLYIRDSGEVRVIEINPFWNKTSSALFGWDKDRDIIASGRGPTGNPEENPPAIRVVEHEFSRHGNYQYSFRAVFTGQQSLPNTTASNASTTTTKQTNP
ncbi:cell division cycle protein 123-like [Pelomyxa schiedti]|nr:cell division cycle protein 123-like [Pelomyxa schiedti]KAH3760046.1 cell division cycle protein 123-like [Pelomyxa schiedti]